MVTWREAPFRIDAVWNEARAHFDDQTLAALVAAIATINAWTGSAGTPRMVAGSNRVAVSAT